MPHSHLHCSIECTTVFYTVRVALHRWPLASSLAKIFEMNRFVGSVHKPAIISYLLAHFAGIQSISHSHTFTMFCHCHYVLSLPLYIVCSHFIRPFYIRAHRTTNIFTLEYVQWELYIFTNFISHLAIAEYISLTQPASADGSDGNDKRQRSLC